MAINSLCPNTRTVVALLKSGEFTAPPLRKRATLPRGEATAGNSGSPAEAKIFQRTGLGGDL
jgi:hypothetical protein